MFVGRTFELERLNQLYQQKGFQMPVIYGRRRVGKTRLIQQFCSDKQSIIYMAIEQNDKAALKQFSETILAAISPSTPYFSSFDSWENAFRFVADQAREKRLILAIDEFPYLAGGNASLPSILQKMIDTELKDTQLFLILCGSSMSFMEAQVLDYKSPLYGRRTAQYKLEPLDYLDACEFFKGWPDPEKLMGYGAAGGVPLYLEKMQQSGNLREAVIDQFLSTDGLLYEEPLNLMKQEMREPALYNSIIQAVATGSSRQSQIASQVSEDANKIAKYLKALLDLRILKKEQPYLVKDTSKSIYRIDDQMFRFWYRFIPSCLSLISMRQSQAAWDHFIEPQLSAYMGSVFEDIGLQYLLRENAKQALPDLYPSFGRWWGNNPVKKQQDEIDIMAVSADSMLFAECKWRNEPMGLPELQLLQERSHLFTGSARKKQDRVYYLLSKSGFSEQLRSVARKDTSIHLVHARDMLNP